MTKEEIIDKVWKEMGLMVNQRLSIIFAKKCLEEQRKEFDKDKIKWLEERSRMAKLLFKKGVKSW